MQPNFIDAAAYRMELAQRCLQAARLLMEAGDAAGVANRAYYCAFHAMRALLALTGNDPGTHAEVMSEFKKAYIKSGVMNEGMTPALNLLYSVSAASDFEDFFYMQEKDVADQLMLAEQVFQDAQYYYFTYVNSGRYPHGM